MIRRPIRLVAVCLALVGQVVGTFGLPAARGSAVEPDAPCGCCLADRTGGRCCCHHDPAPEPVGDGVAPCCRAKKAHAAGVAWVIPSLRSKCQGPHDMVPESVVPASIPPEPPAGFTVTAGPTGTIATLSLAFHSHLSRPDTRPPRS